MAAWLNGKDTNVESMITRITEFSVYKIIEII
jgi:hypothetical protein